VKVSSDGANTVQVLAGGRTLALDSDGTFALQAEGTEPNGVDIVLVTATATHVYGLAIARRPTE
jgi:hypothetical protein